VIFSLRTDSPTEVVQPPVWKRQSPIDIKTAEVQFDPELCKFPLTITYPRHLRNSSKLQNNGNTWKIDVANEKYCALLTSSRKFLKNQLFFRKKRIIFLQKKDYFLRKINRPLKKQM
jgi:hypothetical protein